MNTCQDTEYTSFNYYTTFLSCFFINLSTLSSGALCSGTHYAGLTLSQSHFTSCHADGSGSILNLSLPYRAHILLYSCSFTDCSANGYGGVVALHYMVIPYTLPISIWMWCIHQIGSSLLFTFSLHWSPHIRNHGSNREAYLPVWRDSYKLGWVYSVWMYSLSYSLLFRSRWYIT